MFFLKYLPTQSLILNYSEHFPDGAEPEIASKLELLREASLLLRELEAFFSEADFSLTRFLICVILDRSEGQGGLQHSEIVDRIDVSAPVISRSLKSLSDDGLIEIASDVSTPRVKRYSLTAEGRSRLEGLMPGYYRVLLSNSV